MTATLAVIAATVAATANVDAADLAELPTSGALADLMAAVKALSKEHHESGDTARAKTLTTFAGEAEKYGPLLTPSEMTQEQVDAVRKRVPPFFYFSNYGTLPGETNLTKPAAKIAGGTTLTAKERTVVSLLAHAGEKPSDFLDEITIAARQSFSQQAST